MWLCSNFFTEEILHNAASAFAGVGATLLGFMVAALSILTAIGDQPLLQNMQKTGHYQNLLDELYITATSYAVVMITALFTIFLSGRYVILGMMFTVLAMSFSTLMMISVGKKFKIVLTHLHPRSKG
jgi:hypothetical protein